MSLMGTRSLMATAIRRNMAVAQNNALALQRRTMASDRHSRPKPQWTGIDKIVRTYFPEDWQLGYAIFAFYGSIILFFSLRPSKPKKAPAPAGDAEEEAHAASTELRATH